MGAIGVVIALGWGAGPARACYVCSSEMTCATSSRGALMCLGDGMVCVMGGRCSGGIGLIEPPGSFSTIQVTLLEDASGLPAAGPALRTRNAGGVAVGRQAARLAARAAGVAGEPEIVFSLAGYASGGTAVFRSHAGDGFTLKRESDGRGARVLVSALAGGLPGRVLASERLDEDEALVVRVPFEGRTRVLVVQAPTLSEPEVRARDVEVRRELESARIGRAVPLRPPFDLSVLDR